MSLKEAALKVFKPLIDPYYAEFIQKNVSA